MPTYGTLNLVDTLASSQQTVAQYGEDNAFRDIQRALDIHNAIWQDMVGDLAVVTTDRQRRYGGDSTMTMGELDEFGRADAQKVSAGATVGFPLRRYGRAVQWTRLYFLRATAAELAAQFLALQDADVRNLQFQVKTRLFTATNSTFSDDLVDGVDLAVKALVNADSAPIPTGPSGTTFNAATHTHYLYTAGTSLAASDVVSLIETVVEHHETGRAVVNINRAQEAAVRARTGFNAYLNARLVPASTTAYAQGQLDEMSLYDRAIGVFESSGVSAEIRVKPWIPSGYLHAFVEGGPAPLVIRQDPAIGGGLMLAYDDEQHPLRARALDRYFGVGTWNRTNGAVMYIDTGNGDAYVAPTLTA
jgi:hypothetical protein